MSISDADIVKAASALGLLGSGSQAAHHILAALCDVNLDTREITALIQREPGLAARVLKVANSAYYGHSRHIATLDRALMVLGLDAVRGITAAACLDRSIARGSRAAGIDPRALVNHCVASAFAAEQLARRSGKGVAPEAFMGALLHDFGVPVQERLDPAGMEALIEALRTRPEADPAELERTLVQVDRARCTQAIFLSWNMPESILLAARFYSDPARSTLPARTQATLVHVGVQLALEAGFTYPLEPRQLRVPREPLLESLGLNSKVAAEIAEGLAERVLLLAENPA
ncbi:MAG: HDOD domain-containing protein [Steroidobacteraceae bacterium]